MENHPSFVTLNSFQGPSSLTSGAGMLGGITPATLEIRAAERGVKWALKRVQGDGCGKFWAICAAPPMKWKGMGLN